MPGDDTLGSRIKQARIRAGMTQDELSAKLGMTRGPLADWENDRRAPNAERLAQLEGILGKFTDDGAAGMEVATTSGNSSPIGVWLNRSRLEKSLSVPELAASSGVSIGAIYSIEAGDTPNPRPATIERLEKALGTTLSEEARGEAERSATIEGVGQLLDFNPHDNNDHPTCAGIYVFYDRSQRPTYVGKATNIKVRLRDHKDRFWFRWPFVDTASYVEINDPDLRTKFESVLIRFMKSHVIVNQQGASD